MDIKMIAYFTYLQLIQESRMLFGSLSMPADHFRHVKLREHEKQTKAPQWDAIEVILGIQEIQLAIRSINMVHGGQQYSLHRIAQL